jgi:branched-chain amino acid transport system substrate-binding protein
MKKSLPACASAVLACALLTSCTTRMAVADEPATSTTSNVATVAAPGSPETQDPLYAEAERQFLKGDAPGALATLQRFFAQPQTPANLKNRIRGYNLRGLIQFQTRNPQGAVQDFEAAVQLANRGLQANDPLLHLTRYNLGNGQFQVGKSQEALESLRSVSPDSLDQETRMRFHHLFGNVLGARDMPLDSMLNYLVAASLARDIPTRDTFLNKAMNASKGVFLKDARSDIDRIEGMHLPSSSPAGLAAQLLAARGYMYMGEPKEAESRLRQVLEKADPAFPLRARAEEALNDLSKLTDVQPNTVGVLLPLSGKFGKFGRLCLNAITMAINAYEEMPELAPFNGLRIVVRDSGETAESATEKFNELVKNEKVIGVVGPLLSKQFPAVARKAQEFGVPLLSLSQRIEANAELGSYVFPVALSPNQQIAQIVNYAVGTKNYRRFAILAPSDSFGEEYVNLFWDAVEKAGGEVVGIERYEPKSTDFREEVRRLVGLDYLDARNIELNDLRRRENQYAATLKVKGKLRKRLLQAYAPKAMVDFDAIFIPDDPATIGQIAPSFAVEEVDNIPFLGINTWNSQEIVQRAGKYMQRSLFVDGFFVNSQSPRSVQFVQDYNKFFHAVPGTIETQAYDAAKILLETLAGAHPNTRAKLRESLLSRGKFPGVSGEFRFTPEGVQREAHLLTVKGNSIVEIPAEASTAN